VLRNHNIHYLYQVKVHSLWGYVLDQWKSSVVLGLTRNLALEWENYTRALIRSGIQLQPGEDILLWTGGDQLGSLLAENVYNFVASKLWPHQISNWCRQIWSWDLAYKLKLFIWLVMEGKILTWDSLQRRGWNGPSICSLYFRGIESITHMFVACPFTLSLWSYLLDSYKITFAWGGGSLSNCLENYIKTKNVYKSLPIIIYWHMWLERNQCIFL